MNGSVKLNNTASKNFLMQRRLVAIAAVFLTLAASRLIARQPTTAPVSKAPTTRITPHFVNAPVMDVVQQICTAGGYAAVEYVPVDGRITLVKEKPISLQAALALLNLCLQDRGYAAVLEGSVVKLVLKRDVKVDPAFEMALGGNGIGTVETGTGFRIQDLLETL
jgi:hypothetical protein